MSAKKNKKVYGFRPETKATPAPAEVKEETTTAAIEEGAKPGDKRTPDLGETPYVVYSFDTTGSMQPCLADVRIKLKELVIQMFKDIPGIKIGVVAHGDYCDGANVIKVLDFSDDVQKIVTFIATVPSTGGGDCPECYEYVFRKVNEMKWPASGGSLMLVGDDQPHTIKESPLQIDWEEELETLKKKNVKVFPMQCLYSEGRLKENEFWERVAQFFDTPLVKLQFKNSAQVLAAASYAAAGPGAMRGFTKTYAKSISSDADYATATSSLLAFSERVEKKKKDS